MYKNTKQQFGLITKLFHWLSAMTIFGLFALGYWMVDLDYYSQWYQTAPHCHESIGILLLITTIARLVWRTINVKPAHISTHTITVQRSSAIVHIILYLLLFLMMFSGYLIPTADERVISVFTWFDLPSLGQLFANQEDVAGTIHEYGAYTIISIAVLHGVAALKHHFIDKDATLMRMIK
ncbi:MAG: cytochrome b561 [Alteromonadaceae bacterium]|jgi:cytochrome b561